MCRKYTGVRRRVRGQARRSTWGNGGREAREVWWMREGAEGLRKVRGLGYWPSQRHGIFGICEGRWGTCV